MHCLLCGFAISKGYITYDDTGLVQMVEQGKTKDLKFYLLNITVVDEFTGGGLKHHLIHSQSCCNI
jgi:hypothetical protein